MALDLSKQPPRSPFDEIAGFPWLARMVDKARATYAGTHGDYTPFPCPGDKRFLTYFGIDAEAIKDLIRRDASDEAIGEYVRRTTRRTEADIAAYRREMRVPPAGHFKRLLTKLMVKIVSKDLPTQFPGVDFKSIDTLPKVLALQEGHPVPKS